MDPAPTPPLSPAWTMDATANAPTCVRKDGWYVVQTPEHAYIGHDHRSLNYHELKAVKEAYSHLYVETVVRLPAPDEVHLRLQVRWPSTLGGLECFARDVDTLFPMDARAAAKQKPAPTPPTPEPPKSDERDIVQYVLSSLKRAAENDYSWSLTPNEAGALVAEIEHLRAQRRLDNEEAARLYDFARDKGRALERDDVVAYLRAPGTSCDTGVLADAIERGEHRREEKP